MADNLAAPPRHLTNVSKEERRKEIGTLGCVGDPEFIVTGKKLTQKLLKIFLRLLIENQKI
jgi:hypothetical protein